MCHSTYQTSPAVSRSPGWCITPTTNVRTQALATWWCGASTRRLQGFSNMVVSGQSVLILRASSTKLASVLGPTGSARPLSVSTFVPGRPFSSPIVWSRDRLSPGMQRDLSRKTAAASFECPCNPPAGVRPPATGNGRRRRYQAWRLGWTGRTLREYHAPSERAVRQGHPGVPGPAYSGDLPSSGATRSPSRRLAWSRQDLKAGIGTTPRY